MDVTTTETADSITFFISGAVDEPGAELLKSAFLAVNRDEFKKFSFDFKQVTHIGSAGIGKLLLFYKDVAVKGGTILLRNVSSDIYDLMVTLKLDTVFKISKV